MIHQSLRDEFTGLTNNQAYEHAFSRRLMRPDPNAPGHFLGNTQREQFLKYLYPFVDQLPDSAQIFDFGAGAGEIIDLALTKVKNVTMNLEEPSAILLNQYKERVTRAPNLQLGICHRGSLQNFYKNGNEAIAECPKVGQDLILGLHMIYHLTDFMAEKIHPDDDIEQAVSTMYSFLKPGGIIFIVFANQLISALGLAGRYYFRRKKQTKVVENLEKIYESRDRLLRQGAIAKYLNAKFSDSEAAITSIETKSCLFGFSREDAVAMCLGAELGEANESPFDIEKLEILTDFINEYEKEIGLVIEDGDVPQKNMIRINQPQIVTVIKREAKE